MKALLLAALAAAAPGDYGAVPSECAAGEERVPTDDPYEPFRCVKPGGAPMIRKLHGFQSKPRCPNGFAPEATPGSLQRWRCVPLKPRKAPEPDIAPKAPRRRGDLDAPEEEAEPAEGFRPPAQFSPYAVRGALQLEYPRGWHVTDAWGDEVPTLYFEFDTGRQGKQVTVVLSRYERGQPDFYDLDKAIAKEKEWHNAAEDGKGSVAGLPARFTVVRGASRTAFVRLSNDAYYSIAYSAPEDLFAVYEPAYDRMLKTLRLVRAPGGAR